MHCSPSVSAILARVRNLAGMTATTHTCGTCAHWTRHGDPRMDYYGGCALRPAGSYTVEQSPCVLVPARWKAAK